MPDNVDLGTRERLLRLCADHCVERGITSGQLSKAVFSGDHGGIQDLSRGEITLKRIEILEAYLIATELRRQQDEYHA